MTGEQLQKITQSLGLPTTGTVAVTRPLIEGKLLEVEREPRNAHVVIQDSSENTTSLVGVICVLKSHEQMTRMIEPA